MYRKPATQWTDSPKTSDCSYLELTVASDAQICGTRVLTSCSPRKMWPHPSCPDHSFEALSRTENIATVYLHYHSTVQQTDSPKTRKRSFSNEQV